ncbi:MAG: hypothetical protein PVG03_04825 [Desulfarculaceae bacterium]|jgi:hypothetical protein
MADLRSLLAIGQDKLESVNQFLTGPGNPLIDSLLEIVEKYGGPKEINRKAAQAQDPANFMDRLKSIDSPYVADLEWLASQRDQGSFIPLAEFCSERGVDLSGLNRENAVTLEISALQFFPWLITQAKQAVQNRELMPGRFIRVRNMAEQSQDNGDILATALAMQIMGASYVESLDTRGTDGSNIHLGGPETITGYFGGIGQPNQYPLKWLDEFLHYYTNYGVRQVLNINPGTVLLGYMLNKLGVDNEFKISVYMGNDNPFSVLWTLMTAKFFSRPDDTTSLIGFNLSNSVDNQTILQANLVRQALGLTDKVRFEHHITETWKSIVRQPYNRRAELVEVAGEVPNISAKHEGGEVEVEQTREHPSDILNYFLSKEDVLKQGLWEAMEINYLDKHHSTNLTAEALIKGGIGVICAPNLH